MMRIYSQFIQRHFSRAASQAGAKLAQLQGQAANATRAAKTYDPWGAVGVHTAALTTGVGMAKLNFVGVDQNNWTYFDQNKVAGDPNACGTTTLSMILAHYGLIGKDLKDAKAVDDAVRAWGGYSAPDDLEKFAESKGLNSEGYNNSSFNELSNHLGKGRTVMAMVDGGGGNPHWVAVLNTYKDASGQEYVTVANPGGGKAETMTRQDFEKMWAQPMAGQGGFVNDLLGYHNYLQVFSKGSLPPAGDFDIAYAQAGADGLTDITNGAVDIGRVFTQGKVGGLFSGVFGIVGGAISVVSSIPGFVGRIVEMGGDRVLGWAGKMWNKGGLGNKILGGLGYVGGGILKGVGWVVKNIGNGIATVGKAVGSAVTWVGKKIGEGVNWVGKKVVQGVKAVGKAIADGAKKVGKAIVDGVKAVGKAIASGIKKFFSGW